MGNKDYWILPKVCETHTCSQHNTNVNKGLSDTHLSHFWDPVVRKLHLLRRLFGGPKDCDFYIQTPFILHCPIIFLWFLVSKLPPCSSILFLTEIKEKAWIPLLLIKQCSHQRTFSTQKWKLPEMWSWCPSEQNGNLKYQNNNKI